MDVVSELGYRGDGRLPDEARRLSCRLGVVEAADGSAYLEQGLTKVLAAVYGPHDVRAKARGRRETTDGAALINCQFTTAAFATQDRKGRGRGDRKAIEARQALEKVFEGAVLGDAYPNSQIDVFVEVLEADGGVLAAAINAGTLALADAGIATLGLVGAVSLGCTSGEVLVDTLHAEESHRSLPRLTLAALPRTRAILLLEMDNRLHMDHFDTALERGLEAVAEVASVLAKAVEHQIADTAQALGWTTQ